MSGAHPTVCYHCARPIAGKYVRRVPSILAMRLLGEGIRAYHPACYRTAEREAGADLHGKVLS